MDKDSLNMQIRKFLKKVGVTSQRTIEEAVNQASAQNKLGQGDEFKAVMTLQIDELDVTMKIEESIKID